MSLIYRLSQQFDEGDRAASDRLIIFDAISQADVKATELVSRLVYHGTQQS
ncbi:hypothetical protein [Microcoleus sp. herbarium14]|uniref:hypothetical protein n=1 Tax=Microcoleus sp. herbarium14 TaxID=3055439 RepID=UPI002FCEDB05